MGENFMDLVLIQGFKFPYSLSSSGEFKNLTTGKIRKFCTQPKDIYFFLVLKTSENKPKKVRLHRLLAENFIPNPLNLPCVNHKDGDKLNNSLDNLEWVSHSGNAKHAYSTGLKVPVKQKNRKLKPVWVKYIRIGHSKGIRPRIMANLFRVSIQAIYSVIHKKHYKEIL